MTRNILIAVFAATGLACALNAADITLASGVTVAPGEWATIPLVLTNPAPDGGVYITLSSSDSSVVTINPTLVVVQAGQTMPSRQPQVSGVNFGSATITASAPGLTGDSEVVLAAASLFGNQSVTVQQGSVQNVTFVLTAPSPTALTLMVSSDNPAISSVPATIVIPANGMSATVPVTGVGPGSTLIHLGAPPAIAQRTLNVTVAAAGTIMLPSVIVPLGTTVPFPITLGTPAPPYGVTVSFASADASKVTISPSSVFIAGGQTTPSTQPQVTGVDIGSVVISVSAPGYAPATATVGVSANLSFSPNAVTITGTDPQRVVLVLSASAPWVTGVTAQLTSSNPAVASVPPSINIYPDGSAFSSSVVYITPVGPGTTVITASAPPFIAPTTLTVTVTGGTSGVPVSITATAGTPQTAAVNTPFSAPLTVIVKDTSGFPAAGVVVQFQAPAGGASGSFAGGVNTAVTNAAGVATSAAFTANSAPGSYVVSATFPGAAAPAGFVLTNVPQASGTITLPGNVSVGPTQSVSFPVSISAPAPAGGVTIALSSSDSSKVIIAPLTVFIAAGSTTPAVQPSVTGVDFGNVTISATAAGFSSAAQTVKAGAALSFPSGTLTIHGAVKQSLTLSLSSPAPASGLLVSLSSDNMGVATVVPSVTIAPGATTAAVLVTGVAAGSANITAHSAAPNVVNATAAVTVNASSDITIASGVTVAPGDWVTLPVTLAQPAPDGGVYINLVSSDPSILAINASTVYVRPGDTMPLRQPQVNGINFGSASVSASAYGLTGDTQVVRVGASLVGPAAVTVPLGTTQNVIFILTSPAPAALTLLLSSDNPGIAGVPASVVIPANATAASIPVTAVGAGTAVIHIGSAGTPPALTPKTLNVTVVAAATITLPTVTVPLGTTVPFPITLGTPAPPYGITVTLSSADPSKVTIAPASVFIPGGSTTPGTQPQVTGVDIGSVLITASAPGYTTATAAVGVSASLSFSPANLTISGTAPQRLVLVLSASAPWVTGVTAQLSSSNPNVATVVPSVNIYPDGSSFSSSVFLVTPVGPGTTTITASSPYIGQAIATVTVVP